MQTTHDALTVILQGILPTEKRIHMFQYLYGHRIQMTVYGHAISYGTIGSGVVVSKLFLAFYVCGIGII